MTGGMDWLGLGGRTAVVTGGGGGIGRACLEGFLAAGCNTVSLEMGAARGKALAADFPAETEAGRFLALDCDVTSPESLERAGEAVAAAFGGADILVNNAGILRPGPLAGLPLGDWKAMLAVNLEGVLLASQVFARQMAARGGGALVHVASIAASQPQPFSGAYSPGKAAVAMLSRQLAFEMAAEGIRSNVVSPGLVVTPLSAAFYADPQVRAARERHVPAGRIGTPADMAEAVLFLASARAGYVTGQEIVVDGGLSQGLMAAVPRPGYTA
ncbi:SDR family NAD(P)-dependent oxidoreductase [Poseidonocella sp. HB161398]|uniref:SDR family NAD(P)-dependent oxidoreductase n=1 Tax=Poseidonocella sp. HB161398 TaxID=2320855 RepID=UPI001F0E26CB|nr:SDR family oxidoreductase [Poseidonocella sp. HB161398]